jgi:hypothetical protein
LPQLLLQGAQESQVNLAGFDKQRFSQSICLDRPWQVQWRATAFFVREAFENGPDERVGAAHLVSEIRLVSQRQLLLV